MPQLLMLDPPTQAAGGEGHLSAIASGLGVGVAISGSSGTAARGVSRWHHRPRRRRAAYSIWAAAKTLTMAATVACNFAGATAVGLNGQMIKIASGVSGGWTSVMVNRSALVT